MLNSGGTNLYRVDLGLGNSSLQFTERAPSNNAAAYSGATGYNSLGYNVIDNYLYATIRGPTVESVVRMGWDGTTQWLFSLPSGRRFYVGDIDSTGQYWISSQAGTGTGLWDWIQINLNPSYPNYQ